MRSSDAQGTALAIPHARAKLLPTTAQSTLSGRDATSCMPGQERNQRPAAPGEQQSNSPWIAASSNPLAAAEARKNSDFLKRQRHVSAPRQASKRLRVCAIGRHEGSVLFPLLDVPPLLSQRMRVSVLGHSRGVTSTRGARKLSLRRDRCGSRQAAAKQATRHYVSHLKGSGHGRS